MFAADSISRLHPHHHLPTFSTTSTSYLSMNRGGSTDQPEIKHIWVITGPAGCGKTTVAQYLAKELSLPYVEGDDYHSEANRSKMASNIPLNDGDRWNWLIDLRNEAMKRLHNSDGVIVTCSALKRKYRDVLRVANYGNPNVKLHFVYLRADRKTLQDRVAKRKGHYMKKDMVNSQLENLEEPEEMEWDAMSVDVGGPPEDVLYATLEVVVKKLAEYQPRSCC